MTQLADTQLRQLADKWLLEMLKGDEIERRHGLTGFQKAFWEINRDEEGNIIDRDYSDTELELVNEALETGGYMFSPAKDGNSELIVMEIDKVPDANKIVSTSAGRRFVFLRKEDVVNAGQQYHAIKQADNKGLALWRHIRDIINAENLKIIEPSPDFTTWACEVAKAYTIFLQAGQLCSESNYHEADKLIAERLGTHYEYKELLNPAYDRGFNFLCS